jgi:peptidoglycan/LPS O-acetylase OafA/YrhL
LAALSYRFFERPLQEVLRGRQRRRRAIPAE